MIPRYLLIAAALAMWSDRPARGQTLPQNYGQFYGRNAPATPSLVNTNRYLYDKYFYHQPSVSPYLNLSRRGTQSGDAYSAWVRPEQQRRQQASQAMRSRVAEVKLSGKAGHTDYARALGRPSNPAAGRAPAGSPYYSQWYRQPGGR